MSTKAPENFKTMHLENENEESRANASVASDAELAKILRKIDYRIIPILAVLYLLSFLDRGKSLCSLMKQRH